MWARAHNSGFCILSIDWGFLAHVQTKDMNSKCRYAELPFVSHSEIADAVRGVIAAI